mgnify:FL=1
MVVKLEKIIYIDMKLTNYIYGIAMGAFAFAFASCQNADRDFPDYEGGTTAYFAYQFPVRTLILGNDTYDNSLDVAHKCQIWSTMGGAYNGRDAFADIVVDNSLCDNLYFVDEGGNPITPVLPMPANYYTLSSNVIPYNGDVRGCVEVQFTDEFFKDPLALENTYVIPLLMKKVTGIDHILTGTPREGLTPVRQDQSSWDVLAKDYVLYCVKYKNPWDAKYIRRGLDVITENGKTATVIRKDTTLINTDREHYKENPVNAKDEVCAIYSQSMTEALFPVSVRTTGVSKSCDLILTFNGDKCEISSGTEDVKVSGTGEYITKGTEQAVYKDYQWGSINGEPVQRDILRLSYTVEFGQTKVVTNDTLVVQTRESNKREFFSPKYVKK